MAYGIVIVLTVALAHFVSAIPGPVDLAQDARDTSMYNLVNGYFRIEARILRMENPRGTTRNMVPCDVLKVGKCDTKVSAAIDWHTPNYDFGKDSVPYSNYVLIYDGTGTSSVNINQTIVKDVCNQATRKVNLRIRAVDKDILSENTIDHWSCFIYTTTPPAANAAAARWSDVQTTAGHNGSHKVTWQYRWYFIDRNQCQNSSGSSSLVSRFIPFAG
ncbi:hypothetical protein BV898_10261 [Hypsibius exemplaris]|uniref:Uncharacterized protein n=1 Tax=Hypsibius exemplaris TaxID=2072580 RepID=A0A1W0WK32_HYPEX|nr:hypothetical protein BV898_10261 [Hypsibius exemplaris]